MLLLINCFAAPGQIRILNYDLVDSTAGILYIGIDNHLTLEVPPNRNYSFTISGPMNPRMYKKDGAHYTARVSTAGEYRLSVSEEGKLAYQQVYKVKTIPDPVASLNGFARYFGE